MNLSQHIQEARTRYLSRRWFLRDCGLGLAGIAAGTLLASETAAASAENPLAPRTPHYPAKAKRVIYMFQAGAPSQLELFDHKPELARLVDQPAVNVRG